MARVLLVVPTSTYRAADFLDAAAQLGVEVVVASDQDLALAAVMGGRSLRLPLDQPDLAAQLIVDHDARYPVDAVIALDDQGVELAAEAQRRLGLHGNDPEAVRVALDKMAMRGRLAAAEVPQPAFAAIHAGADALEIARRAESVGWPCVIKPTTLSGSLGVLRADSPEEAVAVAARVRRIARLAGVDEGAPLLVEQFAAGPEVAVEAMLRRGELTVLAIFDKPDPLDGPAFEETIYITPSRLPPGELAAATAALQAATRAMGLSEGPVHGEVRVYRGRASVIEVAARTIGGLCARTLAFGTGQSLESLVIAGALGRDLGTDLVGGSAGVLMIPIPRAGQLQGVGGVDEVRAVPGVTAVQLTVAVGSQVAPPPDGNRYLGFVFARGGSPDEVEVTLRRAGELLVVDIDASFDDVDDPGR